MTDDVLTYSEFPDVTSGNAFGLHAIYPDGNRFDTIIMGPIDRQTSREMNTTIGSDDRSDTEQVENLAHHRFDSQEEVPSTTWPGGE